MRQSIPVVKRLLLKAIGQREEQKAWDMWLVLYPHMILPQPGAKKPMLKFQPFSKFLGKLRGPQTENTDLTTEEIIAKFEDVRKRHQKKA